MAYQRNSDRIPIGSFWSTKGPGRYEFLIGGLHDRTERGGWQSFVVDGIDLVIKITGARQVQFWECPMVPGEIRSRNGPCNDWADAWEFSGYVPGYAIGVCAVYSPISRLGRFDLWEQSTQDYTCKVALSDLDRFFYDVKSDGTAEAALRKFMVHATSGTGIIGGLAIQCHPCWDAYATMKNSARARVSK